MIVRAEYLCAKFLMITEYPKAEKTAKNNSIIPLGEAFNDKSLLISINSKPMKEMIMPIRLEREIFSLIVKYATNGLKSGIVLIITDEMVEDTNLSP